MLSKGSSNIPGMALNQPEVFFKELHQSLDDALFSLFAAEKSVVDRGLCVLSFRFLSLIITVCSI